MKLLVRNLNRQTTEKELNVLFREFGTVQSCNLVMDKVSGASKSFGFVEMPKVGEAKAAIRNLNNKTILGNKIRVKKAEGKKAEQGDSDNADQPST
jgi:RNA recognition motif-containing protein|tara:strand:+ start:179 stop:466 length:288 start_codon:yes stop_codon:yes gene_type:complete